MALDNKTVVGFALFWSLAGHVPPSSAQQDGRPGYVLGRVYEIDKERYRDYIEARREDDPDFDEKLAELDLSEFLTEQEDVTVTARHLATNDAFSSDLSNQLGEYMIRDATPGTFEFRLSRGEQDFPVQQRLDVNVELSFVAELCFVIDDEEEVAWMVSDGVRRSAEVPQWVPRECLSALSECLAMLTGEDGELTDGLLLLLAGSGATSTAIGITSAEQVEASPPARQNQDR